MQTIVLNKFRKTETTNTGVMVQTMQISQNLFRTSVFDKELNLLEVKECGKGQTASHSIAIQQHKNVVAKYSATETQKVEVLWESMGQYKSLYTNLELKGRGISFAYQSDKGYRVYTATKKAFERIKNQYSTKFVENELNAKLIA